MTVALGLDQEALVEDESEVTASSDRTRAGLMTRRAEAPRVEERERTMITPLKAVGLALGACHVAAGMCARHGISEPCVPY